MQPVSFTGGTEKDIPWWCKTACRFFSPFDRCVIISKASILLLSVRRVMRQVQHHMNVPPQNWLFFSFWPEGRVLLSVVECVNQGHLCPRAKLILGCTGFALSATVTHYGTKVGLSQLSWISLPSPFPFNSCFKAGRNLSKEPIKEVIQLSSVTGLGPIGALLEQSVYL